MVNYRSGKTDETIFDIAIEIMSEKGYEEMNMREIAQKANIKAASIYNYFTSKMEILTSIYDYYVAHFDDNRIPLEKAKAIVETGTIKELINAISFTFESDDPIQYRRMVLITKIIYMRILKDSKANAIFIKKMSLEQEEYVKKILAHGLMIGRFKNFDISTYANLFVGCRHAMGIKAYANPEYAVSQLKEEQYLNNLFADLLPVKENNK